MKTKTQYIIAVFSILLFSKTLFASDIEINPSVPPKPGVGSGGSGGELAPTDLADPMSEIEKRLETNTVFQISPLI